MSKSIENDTKIIASKGICRTIALRCNQTNLVFCGGKVIIQFLFAIIDSLKSQ